MALDSTIALIDVDEAKQLLNIAGDLDDQAKGRIEKFINAASGLIKEQTGRILIQPDAAVTERFFGTDRIDYYTKQAPIAASPAPTDLEYQVSSTSWIVTTGTWTYDTGKGLIFFEDSSIFFAPANNQGLGNWRLTYKYGYALASVPDEIKVACADIVGIMKKRFEKNLHAVKTESFEIGSTTFDWQLVSPMTAGTIFRLKRKRIG